MLAVLLLLAACGTAPAAPTTPPVPPVYPWVNGPPKSRDFFPIAVWYQNPLSPGGGRYATVADALVGEHINTIIGMAGSAGGGTPWPERFGSDDGELMAMKSRGLYLVGAVATPYDAVAPAVDSVASILALIAKHKATASFIGYNIGDEPLCDSTTLPAQRRMNMVPTAVAGITAKDPTRPVFDNFNDWPLLPQWGGGCRADEEAALKAVGVASFDYYSMTMPWTVASLKIDGGDFTSVPNDALFQQGLMVQALIEISAPGKPVWPFVESGSDNFGFSGAVNFMAAATSAGSTTLTNNYWWTRFTPTWIGLTVSGPGLAKDTRITGVIDANHVVLSRPATATGSNVTVTIGGGGKQDSDCVEAANICVVQGNAMRPTPEEVNAEVWMTLIAGAHGIQYFCHDSTDIQYCLGGAGSPGALATQANLTYINANVLRFAPMLNAPALGQCSLRRINPFPGHRTSGQWATTPACHNGIVTLATSDGKVPARVLVKAADGVTYLLAQSDARSPTGASFAFTLTGLGGKTATVVYDSNEHYRAGHTQIGSVHKLDTGGSFSDTIGAFGSSYQVKIYAIQ